MLSSTVLIVLFYRVQVKKCDMDIVSNRMVRFERALKMYAPHLNLLADMWCKITEEGQKFKLTKEIAVFCECD